MIDFAGLYQQVEALVAATWTDVVDGSEQFIREVDHAANVPFEAMADQHLPFGIVVFPSPEPADFGEANRAYTISLEVWCVAQVTVGSLALYAKAEAMAAALHAEGQQPTVITLGRVWSDPMPRPQWGVGLPVNRFLREKKLDILAAGAVATLVVGEVAG